MAKQFEMLPEEEQRVRLIHAMGSLLGKVGFERFVCGVIFEPSAEHFPDRVPGTRHGLRLLLHRLLAYVGLAELEIALDVYDSKNRYTEEGEDPSELAAEQRAAAWFAGIHGARAHFGVDVQQLLDAPDLVGTLCHEVAHAFREHHGLVVMDRKTEELLTDLTTVYLGFGILTTNASYIYRAGSRLEGAWVHSEVSEKIGGYLKPNEMAFLLAVQCVLRELPGDELGKLERKAVDAALETTQREMFRAAVVELSKDPEALRRELVVPDPSTWPDPAPLPSVAPLAQSRDEEDTQPLLRHGLEAERNAGANVFRVKGSRAARFGFCGGVFGVLLFLTVLHDIPNASYLVPMLAAAGFVWGRGSLTYECSDPECRADLTVTSETCPKCRGVVRGTIASRQERLAAEESLAQSERQPE